MTLSIIGIKIRFLKVYIKLHNSLYTKNKTWYNISIGIVLLSILEQHL